MMNENKTTDGLRPHAIIVEDESSLSEIYKVALTQAGYFVQTIHNGTDAIKHLRKVSPRLLLLDLNLPGASGDEILDSIEDVDAYKDTKIFLISANARMGRHLANKVDLVLEKPVRFNLLIRLAEKFKPARNEQPLLNLDSNFFNSVLS